MSTDLRGYEATHFKFEVEGKVAHITLNRPDRKNPLTFDSYAELRDLFHGLKLDEHIKAIVLSGEGGNFCSGGDVFEIIEPLTKMDMPGLLKFTRMTGAVVQEMRSCPQPVIAAVNGVCAGAGAILAMASDMRFADESAKVMFLFNRVGLAGCDMGACAILPRLIGQGRASELLYTGRPMKAEEGERWGFFNRLCDADTLLAEAKAMAADIADGPSFANGITKTMLAQEWNMSIEAALESEAQAQAICMATQDFHRAFKAFASKQTPVFEGN